MGKNEQYLHSYREILRVFTQDPKKKTSLLNERWEGFSGGKSSAVNNILSRRAQGQLDRLQSTGFALGKGLTDFFSFKTLAFVAAAGLLGRLSQGLIIHAAGGRGTLGPRSFPLVKEGSLTGFGHFSAGLVTGGILSAGISGYQLTKDLQAERPEALSNFGRNLWWGLVTNAAALGISAAVTKVTGLQAWAARPVEGGKAAHFFRRSLPYGLIHAGIAGGGMLGANALARAFHNRGKSPEEKIPLASLDEAVETYLTMLSLTPADLVLQKPFMKAQLGLYRVREIQKIADTLLSGTLPKGRPIQEWTKKTQSQVLRGIPILELKNQNFASLPSGEMSLKGENLVILLEDGRKFLILEDSKARERTQVGKEVYGKITDLIPTPEGKIRVVFVGTSLSMERIAFSVLLDPATVKAWNITRNAETLLISVKRKTKSSEPSGSMPPASGASPAVSPTTTPSSPPPLSGSTGTKTSPAPEASTSVSAAAPASATVTPSPMNAKLIRLHGPRPGQVRNLLEAPDGKLYLVRETFVLDSSWYWGNKIHPQEAQGFITECEKTPGGKVRFVFDGVYADEAGKDVALKFQAQVDEEIAQRWEIGPKKAAILEPFDPASKTEKSPDAAPPEGKSSEENETRSLPSISLPEEVSSPREAERPWLDAAGQFCGPEELEGTPSVPPSSLDPAISHPGKKITFSPSGMEVDPSGVTMMADSEVLSRPPKPLVPPDFSKPIVTAVRQVNPALIDEMLRNIVIDAGTHKFALVHFSQVEGGLGTSPRYYHKIPPACQESQITLLIKSTDPLHPSASIVDYKISSLSPEVQKSIRTASVLADEVSTVHYPEGRVPKEVVEEVADEMVEEVIEDGAVCSPGADAGEKASPAKEPLEATTHYVPEFEIWWQSQVQEVMSDYFKWAKRGRLKTGGRLRILLNKDPKGSSVQPIWYGFDQFPEKGPLPPLHEHQEPLLLIRIKGDLTRDPKAYQIVGIAKDLPESLKQRWEAMMRRVVKNFR